MDLISEHSGAELSRHERMHHNSSFGTFDCACAGPDDPAPEPAIHGPHSDARCTCGTYLYRSEIPHPDRDVDIFPYACQE